MENFAPVVTDEVLFSRGLEGMDRPLRTTETFKWNKPDGKDKLVVNVVGPNGAGKSVIPKMLCSLDPEHYWVKSEECNDRIATVCPNLGWATIGYYRTKCGGADSITKNQIMEGLFKLCGTNLHIILEGSIVSNTRYTYWEAFKALPAQFPHRKPMFVMMNYPLETYIARIMARNGNQPIKQDLIEQKFTNITKYTKWYIEENTTPVHVENNEGLRAMVLSIKAAMTRVLGYDPLPCLV